MKILIPHIFIICVCVVNENSNTTHFQNVFVQGMKILIRHISKMCVCS